MRRTRAWQAGLVAVALGLLAPGALSGQAPYPSRPIEFVVAFPPGGPLDSAVRLIQPMMQARLGVPITLVTRAGSNGAAAMDHVAKARPDGYTVAATVKSTLTIVPVTQAGLAYRPTDFAAVGSFAIDPQVILVRAAAPWRTLEEVVDFARKNPGALTYGSAGTGTLGFFNVELLKAAYGLDIIHVPFQGLGPVKSALLGGHVAMASSALGPLLPLVRSGDVTAILTTAPRRLPAVPGTPTMTEKGLSEASLSTTMQLHVPIRTPLEAVDQLAKALEVTLQDGAVVAAMERAGLVPEYRDPGATRRGIEAEYETVSRLARKIGLAR